MHHYFVRAYRGEAFQLFGPAHLVALGMIVLLNIAFLALRNHPDERLRRTVRYGLAIVLLLNEASWHLWNLLTGGWKLQTMLPLHLCGLMAYVSAVTLITKHPGLYQLCYFAGIGGAVQALLTPDAGMYGMALLRGRKRTHHRTCWCRWDLRQSGQSRGRGRLHIGC